MNNACSFSTGLSSALMTERVLSRFGAENTDVVFMDTMMEHEDNYRFMDDMERRWRDEFGLSSIIKLREGRSPYQVADDNKMVFNQRRAPCTRILKIEPFMRWLKTRPSSIVVNIGIDFSEVHRKEAILKNYTTAGYKVDFPLLWNPIEHRDYYEICKGDWGIDPPITYSMGFSHANCLGRDVRGRGGCVKLGMGDRIRQYIHMPDISINTAEWEIESHGYVNSGYTMLRDQSGGKVSPRTLLSVIESYEADTPSKLDFSQDGCIHCGIGDFIDE